MGACASVALWKENLYADQRGRPTARSHWIAPMGACASVALWKGNLYADQSGRPTERRCSRKALTSSLLGCATDAQRATAAGLSHLQGCGASSRHAERRRPEPGLDAQKCEKRRDCAVMELPVSGREAAVDAAGTPGRPIWQRRVMMGLKCELPRFSGLILYDERGKPLCSSIRDGTLDKEKHAAAVATLKDLL